ncbi:helicase associated domain-containing protein [Streptomyces sp. NPDC004532]
MIAGIDTGPLPPGRGPVSHLAQHARAEVPSGVGQGVGPDGGGAGGAAQADRWARNLAAAQQFHAREGHLRPARKHVETTLVGADGEGNGGQEVAVKLGAWLDNSRRRAARLSPERWAALDALGMRW